MRKLTLIFLLVLIQYQAGNSQSIDTVSFVPERPGMGTPPDIITSRSLDIEDGFQDTRQFNGNMRLDNLLFSSLLLRYGVGKIAEVRIQTDYVYNRETIDKKATSIFGLDPITIGSKINLTGQRKVLPEISILFNLTLPFWGRKEFKPDHAAPSVYLLMSNTISNTFNICYNYGVSWDGNSPVPTHFCSFCLGINLNRRWSTFIESYSYFHRQTNPQLYVDAGFACMLTNRLQVDFSAAGYLNAFTDFYLLNAGIAIKI